jgi:DNA-binding NarL/FixJ family response regulator
LPVRILIADDHPAVRTVLRALIAGHADWQVCGEAENGFEAVAKAGELKPDVIILDLAMPIMDGVRAAREISSATPTVPILLHTMHGSPTLNLEAKKAGVCKVVSKGESGDDLLIAIEGVLNAAQPGTVPDTGNPAARIAAESMTTPATEKPSELSTSPPDGEEN